MKALLYHVLVVLAPLVIMSPLLLLWCAIKFLRWLVDELRRNFFPEDYT